MFPSKLQEWKSEAAEHANTRVKHLRTVLQCCTRVSVLSYIPSVGSGERGRLRLIGGAEFKGLDASPPPQRRGCGRETVCKPIMT